MGHIRLLYIKKQPGLFPGEFATLLQNVDAKEDTVANLCEAATLLSKYRYDLVLIQVNAPWSRAMEPIIILRGLTGVPILGILYGGDDTDFLRVLEVADDCVRHPYQFEETVARGSALIQKPVYPRYGKPSTYEYISIRGLLIMPEFRRVFLDDQEILLKRREFDLLLFMAQHKDQVLSRDQLFEVLWPNEAWFNADRVVAYHISNLRKLLQEHSSKTFIETVRSIGYRFLSSDGRRRSGKTVESTSPL